jgi:hypothetical protein
MVSWLVVEQQTGQPLQRQYMHRVCGPLWANLAPRGSGEMRGWSARLHAPLLQI